MPSASISEYIRNVVKGVRNSCVTADTKAARLSLNRKTPCSSKADANAAKLKLHQAARSESGMTDLVPAMDESNARLANSRADRLSVAQV
jgi:hypothetical protein